MSTFFRVIKNQVGNLDVGISSVKISRLKFMLLELTTPNPPPSRPTEYLEYLAKNNMSSVVYFFSCWKVNLTIRSLIGLHVQPLSVSRKLVKLS